MLTSHSPLFDVRGIHDELREFRLTTPTFTNTAAGFYNPRGEGDGDGSHDPASHAMPTSPLPGESQTGAYIGMMHVF
ncbi:hypothetical protein BC1002_5613 [Paraburkholderia atlantica]|uniref:Uncharacterized protein n=1 Tax=Paraburkholderia atlantica TaxID=2654982 RepID=D5WJY4_PARAM|nr:hypothetical protein BC1002_5613 [Paraburkholderia atlantica]